MPAPYRTKLQAAIYTYTSYYLNFRFNIFLYGASGVNYVYSKQGWITTITNFDDIEPHIILTGSESGKSVISDGEARWTTQQETLSITINGLPEDGRMIIAIYKWIASKDVGVGPYPIDDVNPGYFARIDDIKAYYKTSNDTTGQESKITINESNNVKQSFDFKYGQIPDSSGGYLAFAGGLHDNDDYHTPLTDWYRSAFPENKYNLLELVGRGLAHHGKKARKIMTGTILFDGQDFSKILVIDNEKYVINGGTYDVTKETLTGEFIEVEPYSTDDYVITGGAVSGGSSNISTGGNKDTLLWTDNAANTKRVNELDIATSDDLAGSNLLIDNPEWSEAKRISADMLDDKFYWDKSLDTTEDKSDKDSWIIRTKHSIVSDKGISAYGLGSTSGSGASGSLGELVNVGQWADAVPTADRVMVQLAGATHWSAKPLADLVGLDTAALAQYLTANSYLKASDISSYLTWANLSGKPTVYPTSWELVTGRPTKLSDLTDDVVAGNYLPKPTWDAVFEVVTVDGTPALKVKYDILGLKGITAYADGTLSGGFSGALVDLVDVAVTNLASGDILKYNGTHFVNVPVSSIAGASSWDQITGKPEYYPTRWVDVSGAPTSLPASDVYPWAKAASKPTYTAAEVGALALSGGVLAGDVYLGGGLAIRDNTASHSNVIGLLNTGDGTFFTAVGSGNRRMVLYSSVDLYRDNGSTQYRIYDSSNFNPSSKLDKSVWDEAFELKTVNGVRVISAKLDFLSVAGISAYATGPSSGGGGGGLDYDLLKQALTGAITPDGYPFTISASFLGAIDKTYLTGKLANTYANKVHTHLWVDITDRPTALPANGGNAESAIKDGNGNVIANTYLPLTGNKTITGSLTVANGFTSGIMKCQTGAYPQLQFEQTNTGVTSILFVNPGNALMYRPNEAEPSKDYTVYHSGNFNPDRKFGLSDIISDLNNAPLNAVFSTNGTPANAPLENAYFQGFTFAMDNNPDFKRQWAFKDKKIWFRNLHAGSWSAWTDVIPLDNYLPLSGNKMITGDFQFKDGVSVRDAAGRSVVGLLDVAGDGVCVVVGNSAKKTRIVTPNDTPVYRNDGKGAYRIYDSSNSNISTVDWAAKNITAAGTVTAPTFVGALSGTATRCYGLAINNSAGESNCLQFMQTSSQNDAGDLPNSNWYHILKFNHGNGDTYYNRTLALPFYSDDIYTRRRVSGTAYSWVALFGEHNANRSDTNWTANTLTATKLVLGGITIDVYNGALRVNGNLVATGGVTAYQ